MRLQKHKLWSSTKRLHELVCFQDSDNSFPTEEQFWNNFTYEDRNELIEWMISQGADLAIELYKESKECENSGKESHILSSILKDTKTWYSVYKELLEQ